MASVSAHETTGTGDGGSSGRHGADTALEAVVIAGFILLIVFAMWRKIPEENKEIVAAAIGVMGTIAVMVAKSLWERRGNEADRQATSKIRAQTAQDMVNKLPGGGGAMPEAGDIKDEVHRGAREGVEQGLEENLGAGAPIKPPSPPQAERAPAPAPTPAGSGKETDVIE